jgi:tRNA(Ile)-lysidine synthase
VIQVLERIRKMIAEYGLLSAGETVVVGVSGGPDSLCLLHALCRLRREYDLSLHVAHLHHGLRGAGADADAQYVRVLASDWGLPCTVDKVDVPSLARQHRLAVEEAARRARYSFLSRVAQNIGARTIAVGHNADDQAETVLMHWLRGSGLAGLRGMLPRTPLSDNRLLGTSGGRYPGAGLALIRPLLEVTRAEVEAYCDFHGLEPRFDLSNLDTTYFRNWLRHEVFPLLESHNPNVQEVIRRSARVMADDYALLRTLLEQTWPEIVLEESFSSPVAPGRGAEGGPRIAFDLAGWRALPTGLQRATLREAIHVLRRSLRNINFVHVEDALLVARDGTTGAQATLPQGLMLTVEYRRLLIGEAGASEPLPDRPLLPLASAPIAVRLPGVTPLPGSEWTLEAQVVAFKDLPPDWMANTDPWRAFLDVKEVGRDLFLRTRHPGDRFQPLGMGARTAKVADFLTNEKVPRPLRDRLPVLVSEGQILWLCGHRLDERARVRESTTNVLVLRFVHS